jgi:hypothetical protein
LWYKDIELNNNVSEEGVLFPLVELFSENFLMVTIRAKEDLE